MHRRPYCRIILALLTLWVLPLWAESSPSDTSSGTADAPDVTVVVTAERTEQSVGESVATTTVITAKELREIGAQTAADALKLVPDVSIRENGQFGALAVPSIRGTEANQTLVLIDGQRLSSASFMGGTDLSKIPVADVARIEVIRGPVSSLYGSEAIGGVINIITRRPSAGGGTSVLGFGSHGRVQRSFSLSGESPEKLGWRVTGSFPSYDGTRPNSDYRATSLSGKLFFPMLRGWALTLYGEDYTDRLGLPGADLADTGAYNPNDRYNWHRQNLNLVGTRAVGNGEVHAQVYRMRQVMQNPYDGYDMVTWNPAKFDSRITGDTQAVEATWTASQGAHQWVAGGEYRAERYNDVERQEGTVTSRQRRELFNTAAFLQDRWSLTGATDLVAGLRLDDHSAAGSKVTPRVALTRLMQPGLHLRASYAEGFRAPGMVELYYDAMGFTGNPNLKPESSRQVEVGAHWQRGKSDVDLAIFRNRVRDQIAWSGSTFNNVERARQQGFELAWNRHVSSAVNLTIAYNYLESIDEATGIRQLRVPHNQVKIVADHQHGPWTLALAGRWSDARPDIGGYQNVPPYAPIVITLPGRAVFDFTVERKTTGILTPYIIVRNLTNTTYWEVAGYKGESRSIETGVRASW